MDQTESNMPDTRLTPLSDVAPDEAWAMVEASPDGMLLTDEMGVMLFVNARLEEMFGSNRAELLGRTVEELIPSRFRYVHRAHRTRYRARPTTRAMGSALDLWAARADGSEFPVEVSLSPLETGGRFCIMATVRDITERHDAEADARGVREAVDAATDGVFIFESDSLLYCYANDGAAAQVGYPRKALVSMTPLHIAPEYTDASLREVIAPLVSGEVSSIEITTIHRRSDGTDIPVEIELKAERGVLGRPPRVSAVARDVTERLERDAAHAARELAEQLIADRERVAGDMHDLVIQRLFGAGMGLQAIQSLINDPIAADRVAATVLDLDQAIAELRGAIFRLTAAPDMSLSATIERVIDDAARRMSVQPVLVVQGDIETIPSLAAENLVAALSESLSNVVRHAEATEVSVTVRVEEQTLELLVVDNGKGISEADTSRGNGLANLERRAADLAGSVTIADALATGGTKVHWIASLA